MRFIGRRERVAAGAARADGLGRGARPPANDAHHAVRRLQLRRARGDPRRRRALRAAAARRRSARCSTRPRCTTPTSSSARAASSGCRNYLLWQSAYSELVFRDELWPDFTREAFEAALDEYERRAAPVRGPLMEGRAPPARRRRREPAARRARARRNARLGPRRADRSPRSRAIAFAIVDRRLGGWVFAAGLLVLGVHLPARAVRDVRRAPTRRAWPASSGSIGLLVAAHFGDQATRAAARSCACVPLVFLLCLLQPRHGGAPGVAVTMLGLAWIGLALRPRGAAARPAPRRRDRRRRARRDVHRRHRRLPRRARVRHAASSRRRSRRTRRSRGCAIGIVIGDRGRVVRRALPGLAERAPTRSPRRRGGASPRRSATSSSPTSSATRARRTPGALFGAHGGALDRLDAVLFTVVAGYYVWQAML